MKVILTFFFCLSLLCSYSQDWTSFTNHKESRDIAKEGDVLWVATGGGLIQWDLTNNSYTKWTTSDGLISNNIRAIAIDIEGNKWLATAHGISKIDPAGTVSNFTKKDGLHSNEISAVATSPNGEIWFGTNEQYSSLVAIRMDLDGVFHNEEIAESGSFPGIGNLVIDQQGQVFVSHYGAVYKRDLAGSWTAFITQITDPTHGNFEELAFDPEGILWGVSSYGIFSYDSDANQTVFDKSDGLVGFPYSLFIDSQSTKWVGTNEGVFVLENDLQSSSIEVANTTTTIVGDSDNIWFGTSNEIYSYNLSNSSLNIMETHDELIANNVRDIDLAEDGSAWLATSKGVVHLTQDFQWVIYDIENPNGIASNSAHKILVGNNDQVFVGHLFDCPGVSVIKPLINEIESLTFDSLKFVLSLGIDNENSLWLGNFAAGYSDQKSILKSNPDGSYEYFDFSETEITVGPFDKSTDIAFDKVGNKYFSARSAIYKVDIDNNLASYKPNNTSFNGTAIFVDSKENIWIGVGDYSTGNYKLLKTKENVDNVVFAHPELDNQFIYQIAEDLEGNIYVATKNGLFKIDENENITRFSTENGLADNHITGIQFSSDGDIWISSLNGVSTTKKITTQANIQSPISQFLSVYPNPSNGQISVEMPHGINRFSTINIFNQLGQLVLTQELRFKEDIVNLELSAFPKGIYFINLTNESEIFIAKILKLD